MKKELPFAVALLATGCLLCSTQFTRPANSTGDLESISVQPSNSIKLPANDIHANIEGLQAFRTDNSEQANPISEFNAVVQASYQENAQVGEQDSKAARRAKQSETGSKKKLPLKRDLYVHQASNPQAIQFLAELAKKISNSQPIGSSIELTGNLFEQVVSASGKYYQMGQGSHKSRIDLTFGTHPNSPTVTQLCDGRFVYKFQSSGSQRSLEFVDLQRIRETAGERSNGITPTGWVASGGIASLFQHLASAFNFGELNLVDQSSVMLRGSWDKNALRQIAGVSEDGDKSAGIRASTWKKVPAQLPHAVEMVFRRDENQNYFPKRIKFLRFEESGEVDLKPMVVLEFSAPQPLLHVTDRHFVVDSTALDPVDMTGPYITRIEELDRLELTAEANETIDRY